MSRRFVLSSILTLAMAATSSAFAPAPVYREPPKSKVPDLLTALQGNWDYNAFAGLVGAGNRMRTIRVRIQGNTWQYIYIMNGVEREGVKYEIVLDAKQNPPTLDLKYAEPANRPVELPGRRVGVNALMGIVKVEGGMLTYRFVGGYKENAARPRHFGETDPSAGVSTMTMKRIK